MIQFLSIALFIVLAAVVIEGFIINYLVGLRERDRLAHEADLARYKFEIAAKTEELNKKTGVIESVKKQNIESVSTGDNDADFGRSLDILSNIAAGGRS